MLSQEPEKERKKERKRGVGYYYKRALGQAEGRCPSRRKVMYNSRIIGFLFSRINSRCI